MTEAGERIRITDLGAPKLSEVQRMALEWCEQHPVELTVDSVLGAAVERVHLDDFGAENGNESWRERLRRWVEEIDSQPERTELGRTTILNYCVRHATNRLLIHDMLRRHPEIYEEEIRDPIIVVGLPRSGTTHLLNLI